MKTITGYLIDRTTGLGISGKTVTFTNLAGAAITTATTYAQSVSSTTDADGKFSGWFELSPGPVNVKVTAGGSEFKVRKSDETAQIGAAWMSDLQRVGWAFRNGVLPNYLNQLAVTTPSGHNIVVATGAAFVEGLVFSIENGSMTIVGTANSNAALNPRLDLVTLRQYKSTAAGQLSGKQEVIVTLGSSQNVAPATPTGADFTDLPVGVVSTAFNAASKTVKTDLRGFINDSTPIYATNSVVSGAGVAGSFTTFMTVTATGLSSSKVYDAELYLEGDLVVANENASEDLHYYLRMLNPEFIGGSMSSYDITSYLEAKVPGVPNVDKFSRTSKFTKSWPLLGITGVSSYSIAIQSKQPNAMYLSNPYAVLVLKPRA